MGFAKAVCGFAELCSESAETRRLWVYTAFLGRARCGFKEILAGGILAWSLAVRFYVLNILRCNTARQNAFCDRLLFWFAAKV